MKRILVFSPVPTHPQSAGHRTRVYSITRCLRALGHKVGFVYLRGMNQHFDEDLASMKQEFGNDFFVPEFEERYNGKYHAKCESQYGVDDWYDDRLRRFLCGACQDWRPDVLWVNYIALSKVLQDYAPACIRVLDTLDVFSHRQQILSKAGFDSGNWYRFDSVEESKALGRTDLALAITRQDASQLRRYNRCRVFTIGHLGHVTPINRFPGCPPTVLYFASGGEVNAATLNRLCNEVFPLVQQRIPEARLVIAGKVCGTLTSTRSNPELLGQLPSLAGVFAKADVVCNPEIAGSGLSIKNLTTLSHGIPLVTTEAGMRGFRWGATHGVLVGSSNEQLAEHIIRLLRAHRHRATLGAAGLACMRRYYAAHRRGLLRLNSLLQGLKA
ncbi:MAG: glycosyltransferase family 4 protein [Bdellovibrionales bacterium]|nr:glycosyltransferase family 4 protein [Bdellovibrionales bacterium]